LEGPEKDYPADSGRIGESFFLGLFSKVSKKADQSALLPIDLFFCSNPIKINNGNPKGW